MTLTDYVDAVKRGWVIILVTVVLALAVSAGLVLRKAETYTSAAELLVAPAVTGSSEVQAAQSAALASRVASYVRVVSGDVVRGQVDEAVGGIGDAGVSVAVLPGTFVLTLTVTSSDAQHAADVAQAYLDVVPTVIEEVDAEAQIRVSTIDGAEVPSAPTSTSPVPTLVAALILGLGLGLTLVILREVLRRERRQAAMAAGPDADES